MIKKIIRAFYYRFNRKEIYSKPDYWNEKAHEKKADGFKASMWNNNELNQRYDHDLKQVLTSLFPKPQGLKLLDMGCGTGRMSNFFYDMGFEVVGMDFAKGAIDIAETLKGDRSIYFETKSIYDLDVHEKFDVFFCWGAFCMACGNGEDLSRALKKAVDTVVPGGYVLICEPIHKGFLARVLRLDIPEFVRRCEGVGMTLQKAVGLNYWPIRLLLCHFDSLPRLSRKLALWGEGRLRQGSTKADYTFFILKKN